MWYTGRAKRFSIYHNTLGQVVEGRTEFDAVPVKLKPAVGKIIVEEFGLPEIVPEEFGGTRA